jgi:phosphoserine aminotransferase
MVDTTARQLPDALSYAAQMRAGSLLNTPPVAAIYSCMLMLRWIAAKGMAAIEAENRQKAAVLYEAIDKSKLFRCPVQAESRSLMNVVFTVREKEQEGAFLQYAASRNIEGIKGHRSVGGFRASLYNAVSVDDVAALVEAMREFEQQQ